MKEFAPSRCGSWPGVLPFLFKCPASIRLGMLMGGDSLPGGLSLSLHSPSLPLPLSLFLPNQSPSPPTPEVQGCNSSVRLEAFWELGLFASPEPTLIELALPSSQGSRRIPVCMASSFFLPFWIIPRPPREHECPPLNWKLFPFSIPCLSEFLQDLSCRVSFAGSRSSEGGSREGRALGGSLACGRMELLPLLLIHTLEGPLLSA